MDLNAVSPTRRRFLRNSAGALSVLSSRRVASAAAGQEPSDSIRVAMVGCGKIASYALAPSLLKIPGVRITALCDILEVRASALARAITLPQQQPPAKVFGSFDEMLAKAGSEFDAVVIATPCWMHSPQTCSALAAGKHVYCEKTMSNSVEGARAMVKAQRQTGKLLQIGHQRRSNPDYIHLRDRILREHKLIGRVSHLSAQWHRGVSLPLMPRLTPVQLETVKAGGYEGILQFANWRWFKKHGGGPLSDLGGHQIDVFNMLLGVAPRAVIASGGADFYPDYIFDGQKLGYEHLDNAHVTFEYDTPENGLVRAHFQMLSTSSYQGFHEVVYGSEGGVLISENTVESERGIRMDECAVSQDDFTSKLDKAIAAGIMVKTAEEQQGYSHKFQFPPLPKQITEKIPHQHHLENFFQVMRGGARQSDLHCPAEEAFRTCVAVMAVNDAVREQRRVELTPEMYAVS